MKRRQSKNISGPRIALIRRRKHLTQTDLAKLVRKTGVGLDRAAIAKIENGLRCVYDYELLAIAQVLKVSLKKLTSYDGQRPAKERFSIKDLHGKTA